MDARVGREGRLRAESKSRCHSGPIGSEALAAAGALQASICEHKRMQARSRRLHFGCVSGRTATDTGLARGFRRFVGQSATNRVSSLGQTSGGR